MEFEVFSEGLENQNYPFPFLKSFSNFISNNSTSQYILFKSNSGVLIPSKVRKSGFLKILQLLFYPISQDFSRLSSYNEKIFLNELLIFIKTKKICDRIEQNETYALFQEFPTNSKSVPFGTYEINLVDDIDKLFYNIQPRYRSAINNASKGEIEIKFGYKVLKDFYSINKKTLERSKMWVFEYNYFEKMIEHMKNNVLCAVAYYKGKPEGGVLCMYSNYGAYYLYGASEEKVSNSGLIKFLHWEVIKYFKGIGVGKYDFVGARLTNVIGTKLEGIQKFKERFGSTLVKGYLWKMDINIFKCWLYDIIVRISFKLKGLKLEGDIIEQELKKNAK